MSVNTVVVYVYVWLQVKKVPVTTCNRKKKKSVNAVMNNGYR